MVVIALFLLFFETGLARWIPLSIAGAALLLIIGVAVMSMSDRAADGERHTSHTERIIDERHGGGSHH